jgi:hypothetical protein
MSTAAALICSKLTQARLCVVVLRSANDGEFGSADVKIVTIATWH